MQEFCTWTVVVECEQVAIDGSEKKERWTFWESAVNGYLLQLGRSCHMYDDGVTLYVITTEPRIS